MTGQRARRRDERGVVLPSPVVMLSIIAVAMAGIAFVATQGQTPTEREVTTISVRETLEPSPTSAPTSVPARPIKPERPAVDRGKVYVEVYNNSGITGLAGSVAADATAAGWQVVGTDNWYGAIPVSTVYYPPRLKEAGKQLGLDLGVRRVVPAVDPMRLDRLTLILTAPLG